MTKQALLVVWYGLSGSEGNLLGGVPESVYRQLAPNTSLVFPTSRQIALEAHKLVSQFRASLVMHGEEYGAERYGLAATDSIRVAYSSDTPLNISSLVVNKYWQSGILSAARALNWPPSPIQWWAAPFLQVDPDD